MENNVSRRNFLGLLGGATGIAALTTAGLSKEKKAKRPKADVKKMKYEEEQSDVLVIGSGMAGLFAAVKAHDQGAKVIMVSKGQLGSSGQTPFAKGIFFYDETKEKLSIDEFVAKVSRSAQGTNRAVFTKQMAMHSKARVQELKSWGFFDSPLYHDAFSKPMDARNIPVKERIVITHLLKENGKIAGAVGFSIDEEKIITFKAKSVILCTGAGGFKPNGFPICDLTHDGTIMAYEIGAKVTGKEWVDGHPGQATNAADCFGGWHGMFTQKPSTVGVEVHHDLGVDLNYKAYKEGAPITMGPPARMAQNEVQGGPEVLKEFQHTDQEKRGQGDEGEHDGPPKGPRPGGNDDMKGPPGMMGTLAGGSSAGLAIHKSEGLVPINETCESTVQGLYAAGDALGSSMSGGIYTQIGSSLAGSAVQGAVAGEYAAKYAKGVALENVSLKTRSRIYEEIIAPLKRTEGYSPAWVTQTLQGIMIPNFVLYIKKESMLRAALAYVDDLYEHHVPMLKASSLHELRLAHETKNMILSAKMKLEASLMRKESRGSHYRLDYPNVDHKNWDAWINIYKDENGKMALEKEPFGTWPQV